MLVAKVDGQGNPVLDAAGKPVLIEVPDSPVSRDELVKAQAKAEEERKAREQLQADMDAKEKARREKELAALPADQQVLARMTSMEHTIAQERAERAQADARHREELRLYGLAAYRERALRDVPNEVADLVMGNTEQEIDQAVDAARNVHGSIEQRVRAQFEAEYAQRFNGAPQGPMIPAPPPNPAYVAPQMGGFPTPTNPLPVAEQQAQPMVDIREMTTEEAVRSGRYGGEVRANLLKMAKQGNGYVGALGTTARHLVPAMPTQQMPGGVQQPMGTPMGPAQAPHMYQQQYQQPQAPNYYQQPGQPQYAPQPVPYGAPPPQAYPQQQYPQQFAPPQQFQQPYPQQAPQGLPPGADPYAYNQAMHPGKGVGVVPQGDVNAARAAIARTHAGQNALAQHTMVAESQSHAQQRGIPSQGAAFQQRFAATPPIQPGSN